MTQTLSRSLRALAFVLLAAPALVAQPASQKPAESRAADSRTTDRKAADKPWDVTAPFGPTTPLAFDTSEGTWINVDVKYYFNTQNVTRGLADLNPYILGGFGKIDRTISLSH